MEKKIPVYEIEIDMMDETGVDLISIVQDPAIMVKGIAFRNQECTCSEHKEIELGGKPGLVHPNCKCQIINGKWKFSPTPDKKYPCELCLSAAATYKNFETFEDVFGNVYGFNLSNQKVEKYNIFFNVDNDKRKIVGPALIPGYKIYRNDGDGEYYITFSADTIEKIVEKFNRAGSTKKINFNHTNQMVNAYINQSWIVEGGEDKSKKYGFNVPVGTWMVEVKVDDEAFWKKKVKGEDFQSFSIEGILGLKKVEMKKVSLEKVSFDFDGTLETADGQEKAQELIDKGDELFIVTARNEASDNLDLYEVAANLNIPKENIVFTNGSDKYPVLGALGIKVHYDNNGEQIDKINSLTDIKGIKLQSELENQIDNMSLEDLAEVFDLVIQPKSGETESEFISRCIPFEIGNGYEQSQAAAICYSKWENKNINLGCPPNGDGKRADGEPDKRCKDGDKGGSKDITKKPKGTKKETTQTKKPFDIGRESIGGGPDTRTRPEVSISKENWNDAVNNLNNAKWLEGQPDERKKYKVYKVSENEYKVVTAANPRNRSRPFDSDLGYLKKENGQYSWRTESGDNSIERGVTDLFTKK